MRANKMTYDDIELTPAKAAKLLLEHGIWKYSETVQFRREVPTLPNGNYRTKDVLAWVRF